MRPSSSTSARNSTPKPGPARNSRSTSTRYRSDTVRLASAHRSSARRITSAPWPRTSTSGSALPSSQSSSAVTHCLGAGVVAAIELGAGSETDRPSPKSRARRSRCSIAASLGPPGDRRESVALVWRCRRSSVPGSGRSAPTPGYVDRDGASTEATSALGDLGVGVDVVGRVDVFSTVSVSVSSTAARTCRGSATRAGCHRGVGVAPVDEEPGARGLGVGLVRPLRVRRARRPVGGWSGGRSRRSS